MIVKIKNTEIVECINELIKKASIEIPKMPDSTDSIERFYVANVSTVDGVDYIFSFYFIPPYKYKGDGLNKMMLGCELCIPNLNTAFSNPVMYEPKNIVIDSLGDEITRNKIFQKFQFLLKNFEDYIPNEQS